MTTDLHCKKVAAKIYDCSSDSNLYAHRSTLHNLSQSVSQSVAAAAAAAAAAAQSTTTAASDAWLMPCHSSRLNPDGRSTTIPHWD